MGRFLVMPLLPMVWSTPWLHPFSLLPSSLFSATWGREGHRDETGGGVLGTKWGWKVSGRQVGQGIVDAVKESWCLFWGHEKPLTVFWRQVVTRSDFSWHGGEWVWYQGWPPSPLLQLLQRWLHDYDRHGGQKSRSPYAIQPLREFSSGNSQARGIPFPSDCKGLCTEWAGGSPLPVEFWSWETPFFTRKLTSVLDSSDWQDDTFIQIDPKYLVYLKVWCLVDTAA